jgi:hypothetical protein
MTQLQLHGSALRTRFQAHMQPLKPKPSASALLWLGIADLQLPAKEVCAA